MKKMLLIIAVVFSAGTINAQEFVEFGAKGGLNFASLSGDNTEGLDGVTSFHLGLVAEFPLTENFSIQPEVLYSGLGASGGDDDMLKLDYISVPVMLKYYVIDGFSLEAGPQISFNVVAERELNGETTELDNISSTDFGAGFGAGYELPMGLFFNVRYVLGFSNVGDGDLDGSDFSQKNNVFQISAGFKF